MLPLIACDQELFTVNCRKQSTLQYTGMEEIHKDKSLATERQENQGNYYQITVIP